MDKQLLIEVLHYPSPWQDYGLLSDELLSVQLEGFKSEYGKEMPEGGSEHFRFGAFLYWLRKKDIDKGNLAALLEAAIADPDQPMAGGVIKEILAHPLSNNDMLSKAKHCVSKSKYYYATEQELVNCYETKVGPYGTNRPNKNV